MTDALARLLENFIDYAGLFPPAKLSMEASVDHYFRYLNGPESPLVARFVCSSGRLSELAQLLQSRDDQPIAVSVVSAKTDSRSAWQDQLEADARAMTQFLKEADGLADIEAFEAPIPGVAELATCIQDLRAFDQVDVYCELPWHSGMSDSLGAIAETEWLLAKARSGGLEASAFPSCEQLAEFLQQCVQLDLVFKLTAGLHHPIRSYREEVQTEMHGFLNVMTALALLQSNELARKEVEQILRCEDPGAFRIEESQISFQDWTADLDDIISARANFAGIGSCSVQEPYEDLRAMGLL